MRSASSRLLLILTLATGLLLLFSVPRLTPTESPPLPTQMTLPDVLPTAVPVAANPANTAADAQIAAALPLITPPDDRPVPDRVILQFDPSTTPAERAAYLAQAGVTPVYEIASLNSVVVQGNLDNLPASPLVTHQPDYFVSALAAPVLNDPLYSQQWGLSATGIPALWEKLPANTPPVTIAVIDSGICANHPDLAAKIGAGWNFIDNNSSVNDAYGHGCAVSGIIAAQSNNGAGIAGVVPNVRLMPLRVLDANGVGRYSDVAAAMVYAVDNGAAFINLSLGGSQASPLLENAVNYATVHHVSVIAAAGNTGAPSLLYPAAYPDVIAVGAVDANLQRSSFSNYGAGIDIQAPGRDIVSTKRDGTYASFSGTSFAAPFVTGALALAKQTGQQIALNGGVLAFNAPAVPELPPGTTPPVTMPVVDAAVTDAVQRDGQARVMIALNLPASAQSDDANNVVIAQAQDDILAQLAPTDFVLAQQYVTVAALAGSVTPQSLAVLQRQPGVARIYLDEPVESAAYARTTIAIHADQVQDGTIPGSSIPALDGTGVNVAVIDSGVDVNFAPVASSVVYQKCFSSENRCPNDTPGGPRVNESQVAADGTQHGTGIAAIITSDDPAALGVAPGAGIVAVRVLDEFGRGFNSDWVRALDWVVQAHDDELVDIDIVNMSLATTRLYKPLPGSSAESCDTLLPVEAVAMKHVLALNIPVFAATGNQGSSDSISAPACISGVIGVGAVYDTDLSAEPDTGTYQTNFQGSWPDCADNPTAADKVTCFTNSNRWMDIVAPGAHIDIGTNRWSGTSQASPHAAGVAALMLQGYRTLAGPIAFSPASVTSLMRGTGPLVTDARNGLAFRRLDAAEAVKALLAPSSFTGCNEILSISPAECQALVDIYHSAGGNGWKVPFNNITLPLEGWLVTNDPCTWSNVTCTSLLYPPTPYNAYTVSELRLDMYLNGTIPDSIQNLIHLKTLYLSGNFSGDPALDNDAPPLTPAIGSLGNLEFLTLERAYFDGPLPPETGNLAKLDELVIRDSIFTGNMPPEIGNLHNLTLLNMWNTPFGGTIPPEIFTLTNLTSLAVNSAGLSGTLPDDIKKLTNLTYLNLSTNGFTGTIPTSWSALTKLRELYLDNNALRGTLPSFVFNLVDMKYLNLSGNNFVGGIPTNLNTNAGKNLESLDLSFNRLNQALPDDLDLPLLKELRLNSNELPGAIPAGFGNHLPKLELLELSDNQLTGAVPTDLDVMTSLKQLSINLNRLTGPLPAELGNLGHLTVFNAQNNQLSGTVPASLLALPVIINLTNNHFTALPSTIGSSPVVSLTINANELETLPDAITGANMSIQVRFNRLAITNPAVITWLNSHTAPGWAGLQLRAPDNVVASGTSDLVHITWDEPVTGLTVQHYLITLNDGINTTTSEHLMITPSVDVGGLRSDTVYTARVQAIYTTTDPDFYGEHGSALAVSAPFMLSSTNFCSTHPGIDSTVCKALESFYYSTNGAGWTDNTDWLANGTPCTWHGISCTGTTITGINLKENNLTGRIPETIGDLTTLQTLNLSSNNLGSVIPVTIGKLTGLTSLNLSENELHNFPVEIGSLTNLVTLDLHSNFITDRLPTQIGNLTNLVTLDLRHVVLLDRIPATIGNLINLETLDISENGFSGSLPPEIGSLTKLTTLKAGENLTGAIPTQIGNLRQLITLELKNNAFSGELPASLGDLINLQTLSITTTNSTNRRITGTLPAGIASLTDLRSLTLFRMNLSGGIPAGLDSLTLLQTLDLKETGIEGSIPPELGSLAQLKMLDLSWNDLSGAIPPEIGNLPALKMLHLEHNSLSGTIPDALVTGPGLSQLQELWIAHNNLTGALPAGLNSTNFPALNRLRAEFNYLSGDIPTGLTGLGIGFIDNPLALDYNYLTTTDSGLLAYLAAHNVTWQQNQILPPTNLAVVDVSLAGFTLTWTPRPFVDSADFVGILFRTNYELWCSDTLAGTYTRTAVTDDYTISSLLLPHFADSTVHYCKIRTMGAYTTNWVAPSDFSPPIAIVTPAAFVRDIAVDIIPAVFELDVPEPDFPEDTEYACSAETGRAVSFRGSGRAVSFRGSGRAVSFRGSGEPTLIHADTQGSEFDTVLLVWRVPAAPAGDPPTELTEANAELVACSDNAPQSTGEPGPDDGVERPPNAPSFTSAVTVPFDRDYDLYFFVFARNNEFGQLVFNIDAPIDTGNTTLNGGDYAALTAFYAATGGAGWKNTTGKWFSDDNPCGWYGITCSGDRVIGLDLHDNRLSGHLPAAIDGLTALQSLDLSYNALGGGIPPELGNLAVLNTLRLNHNALAGAVPDAIETLSAISTLNISYNGLTASGAAQIFLNTHAPNWDITQTIMPTIYDSSVTADAVTLNLDVIAYSSDSGYYETGCNTDSAGPFYPLARTADKVATGATMTNMLPGTTFYCAARTFTAAHDTQHNAILSPFSSAISRTTSLPASVTGSNGHYVLGGATVFPYMIQAQTMPLTPSMTGYPVPGCATHPGRSVTFRGTHTGPITVNTSGTQYPHTLSVWKIPTGGPVASAVQMGCVNGDASSSPQLQVTIPAGFEYYVEVTGTQAAGGMMRLTLNTLANQPPVTVADLYDVSQNSDFVANAPGVLANDSDPENGIMTVSVVQLPRHGVLNLNANGRFVYHAQTGYIGQDTFTYRACDSAGACSAAATVTLNISGVTGSPVTLTLPLADAVNEDGAQGISARPSLWVGNMSSANVGYLGLRFNDVFIPPGTVITSAELQVYSPNDQNTALRVLAGGDAADNSAPFSPSLPPSRRTATVARTLMTTFPAWSAGSWNTVSDVTGIVQEILNRPGWQKGNSLALLLKGAGSARQFRMFSGAGSAYAPRLVINYIYPSMNDAPIAQGDTAIAQQGTVPIIRPFLNDSDPNHDALTLGMVTDGAHGTTTPVGTDSIAYAPDTGYLGYDTFTYEACDLAMLCSTATVTVDVVPVPNVPTTITVQITAAANDANEDSGGLSTGLSSLRLGSPNDRAAYLALRFEDLPIPPGSDVTAATLEIYSPAAQSASVTGWLAGEAGNSAPYSSALPPSRRALTAHGVTLNPGAWGGAGWQVLSNGLAPAIKDAVNTTGWQSHNALGLIFRNQPGSDSRMLVSYDSVPAFAPRLTITFIAPDAGGLSLSALNADVPAETEVPVDTPTDAPTEIVTEAATDTPVTVIPTDAPAVTETSEATGTPVPTDAATDAPPEITPTDIPAATVESVPAEPETPEAPVDAVPLSTAEPEAIVTESP